MHSTIVNYTMMCGKIIGACWNNTDIITNIFNPKTVVDACQLGKLLLDIEEVRKDLDLGVEDD